MAWQNLSLLTHEAHVAAMSVFGNCRGGSDYVASGGGDEQALFELDLNTTPLWSLVEVNVLFPENVPLADLIQQLQQQFSEKVILDYQVKQIAD